MHLNNFKNKYHFKLSRLLSSQSGMTLVEMMVVVAIFMIVSGIVIFDYNKFRSDVSINNLTDDIALSIRKAQNYAIGVKRSGDSISGYGIYFTVQSPSYNVSRAGSYNNFLIFNDLNNNKQYDWEFSSTSGSCGQATANQKNECMEMITINTNDYISTICALYGGGNYLSCTTDTNGSVAISFLRPNPEAYIYACTPSCRTNSADRVLIYLKNRQSGVTKFISVSNLGQISINN